MKFRKREREAIVQFLDDLHSYRGEQQRARARQRLFARTRENPGPVLRHLRLLPANTVQKNPLLRQLWHEAAAAALPAGVCG